MVFRAVLYVYSLTLYKSKLHYFIISKINPKFSCSICPKNVAKNHNAVYCDICNLWVHLKCINIRKYYYRKVQNDKELRYCKKCIKNIVPFSQLSDNQINNLMLGRLMTRPKQIIQENQVIFHNEIFTPDDFHNHLKTLLPSNFYIRLNISSRQSENIGPQDVSWTSPSNVPRTSPKDPI